MTFRALLLSGGLALLLLTQTGCALLLRAAAAVGRGAGGAAAARIGAAGAASAGAAPVVGAVGVRALAGGLVLGRSALLAAGVGAIAAGHALPHGIGRLYASGGQYLGRVETRGSTTYYHDQYGNPAAYARMMGSTRYVYDMAGREIGHSKPAGPNRVNFYSPDGQLLGYDMIDGARVAWHYDTAGKLVGYTILGNVDLVALGLPVEAMGFSLAALAAAGGREENKPPSESSKSASEPPLPLISEKVVNGIDAVVSAADECKRDGDVEKCRSVSFLYGKLSLTLQDELKRLTKTGTHRLTPGPHLGESPVRRDPLVPAMLALAPVTGVRISMRYLYSQFAPTIQISLKPRLIARSP